MYLSKAKVSYMLITESPRDHCPRKVSSLLATQFLPAEEVSVLFLVSTDELLLVLQAATQERSRSHSHPCYFWLGAKSPCSSLVSASHWPPPHLPSRLDPAPCHHLSSFNVRDEESSVLKKHIGTLFLPKTFEILSTEDKHGYHERKVL